MAVAQLVSTNAFKIEKGVALPKLRGGSGYARYPFAGLEVGDSFLVHGKQEGVRARSAAHVYGRNHGKRFACRSDGAGMRIWRTA